MRTEIAIISALALVLTMPVAFAQVVETQGQNYDLVEDYFIGEAIWNSHPERIMDNGWKNYALTNTGEKVIFNTNSVGSFVFDKNSCSYSIYENGYNGQQVIPSVSAVASYLDNGQWSNLPVNDEACTVKVTEYENGVFLTSTKVITEDITQDVFISYTGTTQNFYSNSTNANFNLVQFSNGTNQGYLNGETVTVNSVEVEKFVQELDLNIHKGFKETFKVWNDGDQPLGISQTIHSGDSITIGETVIDIAQLNGQSFDRQYIIDNEAEILAITDSVNYDFDTGIESLTNVNIIFEDNTYKVNMDYADGGFVGYLEIDPTFTATATTQQRIITSTTGNYDTNDCTMDGSEVPSYSSNAESKYNYMSHEGNGNGVCAMPMWEYDISSIPNDVVINDVDVVYDIVATSEISNLNGLDFITSDEQIGATSGTTLKTQFEEMVSNPTYLLETNLSTGTGLTAQLGTSANSDIQSSLSQGWFTIVTRMNPFDNHPNDSAMIQLNNVELQVTYAIAIAPTVAPTGLSTVTGIPLELDWTGIPTSGDGGSSITGYNVYRSLNEFAYQELPNSSGSDSQLTFTDNEFLIHGFETVSTPLTHTDQGWDGYLDWNNHKMAIYITANSELVGKQITEVSFWMKNSGSGGSADIVVYDDSNTIVADMGSVTASQLTSSYTKQTFNSDSVTLGADYKISINKITGSGSNFIKVAGSSADSYDGTNTYMSQTDVLNWNTNSEDLDFEILYSTIGLTDKSANSITVGTVAGGVLLAEQTQLDNDDQLNSNTIEDWGIVVGAGSPMVGEDIVQVDFYGKRYQLSGYNQMCEFEVLDSSDSAKYEHSFLCEDKFTTTAQWVSFDLATPTTISAGDRIVIHSEQGGATNYLNLWEATSDVDSGVHVAQGDHGAWNDDTGRDPAYKVYSANTVGTSTTGIIDTAIQNPNLAYTDSNLPDNTDDLTIGGWVKLDAPPALTFEDNFDSDNWTHGGANSVTSGLLDWGIRTNDKSTFDLGTVSDDKWVLQFKWTIDSITRTSITDFGWFGISDSTGGKGTSQDFVGFTYNPYNSYPYDLQLQNIDGTALSLGTGNSAGSAYSVAQGTWSNGDTYYYELVRDGTTLSLKVFSDEYVTQVGSTISKTIGSESGLRYLIQAGDNTRSDTQSGHMEGSIDLLKFYNGVTSSTGIPEFEPSKLLGLNDVTFNVGATTASVGSVTSTEQTTSNSDGTSSLGGSGGSNVKVGAKFNTGHDIIGKPISSITIKTATYGSPTGTAYLKIYDSSLNLIATSTNGLDVTTMNGDPQMSFIEHEFEFSPTVTFADGYIISYEGASASNNNEVNVQASNVGTDASNTEFGWYQSSWSWQSGRDMWLSYSFASPIISATGLTDNTSTAQHYAVTRDSSNLWTLYQNGASVATATDSTSLGANSGTVSLSPDGTINGATTGQTGKIGSSMSFDQSNDYIDSGSTQLLSSTISALTTNVWIKPDGSATTGGQYTFGISPNDGNTNNFFTTMVQAVGSGNGFFVTAGSNSNQCYSDGNAGTNWNTSDWFMVTMVFDGSQSGTDRLKMYVNGVEEGSVGGSCPSSVSYNSYLSIGRQGTSGQPYFGGQLDEGSIWETALSQSQITALYNSGSGTTNVPTTDLKAHFDFDDTGSTLTNEYNSVSDYTTNISGSLDEFFINSDALTSTEIDNIYDRGGKGTLVTTTSASTTDYDDSSVTGGNTYYFAVAGVNAIGEGVLSSYTSGLAGSPPSEPTSVATTISSPNSNPLDVTLSWSAPTNVGTGTLTGFEIYRDGTLHKTVGLVTSDTDTVPSVGTYVYSLKSLATHGNSGFSATSSIDTPTAPPAPNAPTLGITSPNPSPFDVTVSWSAQSNGGSAITSTEIFRSATETGTYSSVGTVSDLDFTDTVPSAGTWYYKIASTNLLGSSSQGTSANIATPTVPSSDSSTTLAIPDPNASPRGITVSLVAPSSDGGSTVTGYNIYSSDDNVTFNSVASAVTTDTTITVPTGGTWYFKSEAINNVGTANQGSSVSIATPSVPTASGVTLSIPSPDPSPLDIVAVFTAPSSDGGSSVTGYNLLSSPDDVIYNYVAQAVTADQTITVDSTGTWYFKSQALNNVGNGTLSSAVSITTATVPDAPSITLAINDPNPSPLQVTTTFVTPTNNGGSSVTGFNLYHSSDGTLYSSVINATNSDFNYSVGSSGTHYFKAEAISNAGTSNNSTAVTIATPNAPDASSVTLAINNPNTNPFDVTATFVAPSSDGGSSVTGYNLFTSPDDTTYTPVAEAVTADQSVTLASAGTWYFKSQALNNVGNGTLSSAVTIATPTVPDAPSITLATNNPNTNPFDITATFVAPANNGGSALIDYNLQYSSDDSLYVSLINGTTIPYTHTVSGAGTHYFKAEVTNNVGTSLLSSSYSTATPTVPSAPTNANVVISSIDSAPYGTTVTWSAPTSDGGSSLINYKIYRQTGTGAFSLVGTTTQSVLTLSDTVPSALNQSYTYKITALNNVGESTAFVTTTITTGDVPSAPTLSGTAGTTSLSWNVPNSDATVTGYKVYRDGSLMTTVTGTSHSDFQTLTFGNAYVYTLKAVSIFGDSVLSNTFTTTPETEITGMIAQGVTGTGVVIDWDEPAYYQGQVTNYEVYYSEITASVSTPTTSAGTTTNTYSNFAPQLDYNTSYIFGVKVNSPLGNSGFSNYVTVTTSIDNSIVAFDPTTGGMEWFDIDSVNDQTVNVIEFQRETQTISVNGTATAVDTLQVAYPSWWDDMTCDVDYKFAQKTDQYVEGTDMTSQVMASDANKQVIGFNFQDVDNEVIEIECAPQQSQQDDGVSAKYVMTQNTLGTLQQDGTYSTGLPNIPLVTQVTNFTAGEYGTDGDFGAIDIVGLFVILVSMVGFNRVSPIVGVLISASTIFALSFFGLIAIPTVIIGVIGLVIFLAWGITRNR
uniref:ORF7 n=1 Tax=Nitrosopumilaceae spindle-shaped virus TaxID=3065433 RepID=A0AAT9J973_9VIRU